MLDPTVIPGKSIIRNQVLVTSITRDRSDTIDACDPLRFLRAHDRLGRLVLIELTAHVIDALLATC